MIKKKLLKYTVIYTSEPEGGFTVTVPDLSGCVTYGRDLKEAEKMAKDAIELYLQSLKAHKEPIQTSRKSFIGSVDLEFPQTHA
ncbi:type II toxin-antitoxin system HicB family antitoxin [Candidatus Daviesbacteria bacterium]|nr:type II toxin-antitoxin system HicB family antitoxin [Candidatus Daviesbacteria bacterium]